MFQLYPRRSSRPSCAQLASPAGRNTPKLNTTSKSRKILQSDEDFSGLFFTPARNSKRIRAGDFYFRLFNRTLGHSPRPAASRNRTQNTPSREHFPCPKTLAALARPNASESPQKQSENRSIFFNGSSAEPQKHRRNVADTMPGVALGVCGHAEA